MSNVGFENRMISTDRNIRQRCQLKYSKHGTFTWDKWTDYDCIFSSFIDVNGIQQNQLELHSKNNIHEPNGKIIDLKQLHSLTCLHGNTVKNEPKNIIILKTDKKRHRFGFDNVYDYNQWKTLLDGVYNSTWHPTDRDHSDENAAVNMLYESATAMRYRVQFADLETQEILCLPSDGCKLVFDTDKVVLEQRHDKQYTFPRSTIRSLRLVNENELEFELGSRAPVQGFIRFRFESPMEARACYLQWNEGITTNESPTRERFSVKRNPQYPISSSRIPLDQQYNCEPPPPPPRSLSTRNPYYNTGSEVSSSTITHATHNEYSAFHTLV